MNLHQRWRQAADDDAFESALFTLESMGLIDQLDDLVDPQQRARQARGLSMPVLLTALLLTHRTISGFTLTDAFQLLTERLSPTTQMRHGLRDDLPGHDTVTYRQVQYVYRRFSLCTDPEGATDDADWSRRLRFWTRLHDALVRLRVDDQLVDSARVVHRGDPDAVCRYRPPVVRGLRHVANSLPGLPRVTRSDSTPRATSEEANAPEHDAKNSSDGTVDRGYIGPGAWTNRGGSSAYGQRAARERTFRRLRGDS